MKKIYVYFSFLAGAGIGSAIGVIATQRYLKSKYEKIAQEEIDSMKEYYSEKYSSDENFVKAEPGPHVALSDIESLHPHSIIEPRKEETDTNIEIVEDIRSDASIFDYVKIMKDNNYINYSDYVTTESIEEDVKDEEEEDEDMSIDPYVISPDEFGTLDDYDIISFTYYSDGVLADEYNDIVANAEELVGTDYASHFGDFEDDSVFIRNDIRKIDFEILRDYSQYSSFSIDSDLEE